MNFTLDELVDEHLAALGKLPHATGMITDRGKVLQTLQDIIAKLKAAGITPLTLLRFIAPILASITAGTPAGAIITAILSQLGGMIPTGATGT